MCLSVPMKIESINGDLAEVEAGGVKRQISVLFLEDPKIGEYVLVHAGFAIDRLNEEAAMETMELLAKLPSRETGI